MLLEHNHTTDTHTDTLKHGGMCGWMVGERMYKNESNYFNSQSANKRKKDKQTRDRQETEKKKRKQKLSGKKYENIGPKTSSIWKQKLMGLENVF